MLGLIPGTVALTYLGSLMGDIADIYKDPQALDDPLQAVVWVATALVTTLATLVILAFATRRTFAQVVQTQGADLLKGKDKEMLAIAVE